MIDPKCPLNYTMKIHDHLIDLRPLKGNYFVTSKDANFSVALCGAKQKCTETDSDISTCKKSSGGMIPLSSVQNERIIYNQHKNEIVYRGTYKGKGGEFCL